MARLILDGVTRRYGDDRPAVDGLFLDVAPGTFLALLGPSGCGKTTTLRLIAGFEAPDEGRILFGERLLADRRHAVPPEERDMAMVFQSHALWPHMSVADNAGYPLKVRGVSGADYQKRVAAALEAVELGAFRDRRPADLSGGQKQRVALARCLVTDPKVILFDEPLASLDRHLKASLEATFRDFHRRTGATIVYVTHDQGEAMALADQVAVMSRGRVVQIGSPQSIYRHPENADVAGLIGQGVILELTGSGSGEDRELPAAAIAGLLASGHGSPVRVLIRPEDIADDPGGEVFTVADSVFRGERYMLELTHSAGHRMFAFSQEAKAPGTAVRKLIRRAWRLAD